MSELPHILRPDDEPTAPAQRDLPDFALTDLGSAVTALRALGDSMQAEHQKLVTAMRRCEQAGLYVNPQFPRHVSAALKVLSDG